jgi:hypothetical protein
LRGTRPVNERDELFRYAAQELDEPALCDNIPWSAISPGGFFLAPSYERSNCYAYVAGRTRRPSVCWKVRRWGAFSFLSQQTSMWSCLNDAWHGLSAGIAVAPASLVDFFGRLGYDPGTLHVEGITPPIVNIKDIETIASGYQRFLDELSNGQDTVHMAARKRFVERVRRLTE